MVKKIIDYCLILIYNSDTEVLPNLVHLGRLRQEPDHVSLRYKGGQGRFNTQLRDLGYTAQDIGADATKLAAVIRYQIYQTENLNCSQIQFTYSHLQFVEMWISTLIWSCSRREWMSQWFSWRTSSACPLRKSQASRTMSEKRTRSKR